MLKKNRYILRLLSGRRRLMQDEEKCESVGPGRGIMLGGKVERRNFVDFHLQ